MVSKSLAARIRPEAVEIAEKIEELNDGRALTDVIAAAVDYQRAGSTRTAHEFLLAAFAQMVVKAEALIASEAEAKS